jgi:hypothetical protein
MNKLHSELDRLYLGGSATAAGIDPTAASLVDAQGGVRALVMELARPADWQVLSKVWQGVQSVLELPAPAIAVSGTDGLQLWFALAQPIEVAQAQEFLGALCACLLPGIAPARIRLMPAPEASTGYGTLHAPLVPALDERTGHWSAFVAPDLASVFAETPWLDVAPSDEGQAALLRGLQPMKKSAFDAARKRLAAERAQADVAGAPAARVAAPTPAAQAAAAQAGADARRFLIGIMNDETVPLALRIEAAKALLSQPG